MRHNRRAVMAEHYKLYLKKNIFNGRYFVRNVQIAFCALIVFVLLFTVVALSGNDKEAKKTAGANKKISVKEALFGNNEVTESEITSSTEAVVAVSEEVATVEATTEADEVATEISEETTAVNADDTPAEAVIESVSAENVDSSGKATDDTDNENDNTNDKVVAEVSDETEKSEFEDRCIANVDETLNVRKDPSADAEFVGSMSKGSIATVEGREGEWTKIKSGDVEGYVLTEYILTGKIAEAFAKDYVTILGTAKEDGINIRKERSVESDILKVLDKGDSVSIIEEAKEDESDKTEKFVENTTEEATENNTEATTENNIEVTTENNTELTTEGITEETSESVVADNTEENVVNGTEETTEKTTEQAIEEKSETTEYAVEKAAQKDINWLTVMLDDGQVGYVSKDYIEVDRLYTLAVSAEELQRREEERLEAERAAAEAAAEAERLKQQQAAQATQTASSSTTSSKSDSSSSYEGAKTTPVTATESGESLGKFYITAYCGCKKCSGGHNKTASGTTPTQGRTIAADTSVLPFGTQVVIDGVVYTVEDRGSGVCGNHIDIFFATHEDALAFGSKTVTVYKY